MSTLDLFCCWYYLSLLSHSSHILCECSQNPCLTHILLYFTWPVHAPCEWVRDSAFTCFPPNLSTFLQCSCIFALVLKCVTHSKVNHLQTKQTKQNKNVSFFISCKLDTQTLIWNENILTTRLNHYYFS